MARLSLLLLLIGAACAKESKNSCAPISAKLEAAQGEIAQLQKQLAEAKKAPELNAKLSASQSENAKLQKDLQAAKAVAPELTAKLTAAQSQIAELQEKTAATNEVPYLSAGVIVDSLGSVKNLAVTHAQGNLNVDFTKVYTVSTASIEVLRAASTEATAAASNYFATATKAVLEAKDVAKDLHAKHVEAHTREYYLTSIESYTAHVEPQLVVAKKAYYDTVHPHVGKASETIYAGVGAAFESGKAFSPKVMDMVQMVIATLNQAMQEGTGKLAFLSEAKAFVVMGRKFSFNHGWFDMALAVVQSLIAAYVFTLCLAFVLKYLVWKLGMKLLGKKLFLGVTRMVFKISFKLTRFLFAVARYLLVTVVALTFSFLLFAICSGLGVGMLHAVEKNFTVGLTTGVRLGAGVATGLFLYLILKCTCCKKRKAKPVNGNAKADAKAAPKNAAAKTESKKVGDAKQATKPKKK